MQTVIISLMILSVWSTILKMSFGKIRSVLLISIISALLIGFAWPLAAEQSKTQIADWLADPSLMADIAVIITIEVGLQMSFCLMSLSYQDGQAEKKIKRILYHILKYFPGLLYFVVLFTSLVSLVFVLPGAPFSAISWSLAASVLLLLPLLSFLSQRLMPAPHTRLELLFLINLLIALMGIVATVNSRTSMIAVDNFKWESLLAVSALILFGSIVGFFWHRIRFHFKNKKSY